MGLEGVVLSGVEYGYRQLQHTARLVVESEGVSFESMHFPLGVQIQSGSLTMSKCTSTGREIDVEPDGRLVMEDSRVFGTVAAAGMDERHGVRCSGAVKATRCTVENNAASGVCIDGARASAELVECVICKNAWDSVHVSGDGKVMLRSGTISENRRHGVGVWASGKVTVAKAEEGKPQTVATDSLQRQQQGRETHHGWGARQP